MRKQTLTILCGLPGSGKSTWLQKNKRTDQDVICLDEIRDQIFGHQFHRSAEPWIIAFAKSMARILLSQGRSLVIDSTALLPFIRNEWNAMAKHYGARTEVIYFDIPYEVCVERNRNRERKKRVPISVLKSFRGMLIAPDPDIERYDRVIIIKNK